MHVEPFADMRELDYVQVLTGGPERPGVRRMIVTPGSRLRIALIVLLAVILQVSFFSYLSILGATPDALAVVVVALGLLGGGVIGAVCGFAAGILLDSILLQTLGVSSLVLLGDRATSPAATARGSRSPARCAAPLLAAALTALAAARLQRDPADARASRPR